MVIMLIVLALFVIGGGGTWIISQIVSYRHDKDLEIEREREERERAMETERALRQTLVMLAERKSSDRVKAA